ncbi:MAG: lytic transglycosylase domain-containing protein [Thermodesulfobacteriota bacterium]|jgi:soluble lytic murein transglycosylase-like protein|nr:MAG: lytic transglycosylase domain-containing protein [Thermodesulfobacteriota bacterium]
MKRHIYLLLILSFAIPQGVFADHRSRYEKQEDSANNNMNLTISIEKPEDYNEYRKPKYRFQAADGNGEEKSEYEEKRRYHHKTENEGRSKKKNQGTTHVDNDLIDKPNKVYVYRYVRYARSPKYDSKVYDPLIREIAAKYEVDCDLVRAVIKAESDFNTSVVSPKGAKGIMQLMPGTAEDMSVKNIFSPRDNIEGGVKHLRRLLNIFNNDLHLTVAAYNAGENAVIGCNYAIPPYDETREYVRRVLSYLRGYKNNGAH